jgi:hypothetical protein
MTSLSTNPRNPVLFRLQPFCAHRGKPIMSQLSEATQKLVDQWLEWDVNEQTRTEIRTLAHQGNESELQKILGKRISFGTAGSY